MLDHVTPAMSESAKTSLQPSLLRRLLPKLVVSLLLGALFAWLAGRGGIPLIPPRDAFRHVVWWTIPAYLATLVLMHFFRASRWRYLIAPIKPFTLREVIALNWIGFFAIFVLPLRIGELARPALTKMRHAVPISAGVGTVAVERVSDGLLTSLCVAFGLFALPQQATDDRLARHLPVYGYLSLAVFAGAFVALGLFLWQRTFAVKFTHRIFGIVSPRLGATIATKVDQVAEGIRSLADPKLRAGFLLESLVYWLLNAFGMWLLAWGCGLPMTPSQAIAVMGILAIGVLLPAGPGMFGNFQLAVSAALKLYLPASLLPTQGAVYIFLLYGLQAVVITLAGVVPLYTLKLSISDLIRIPTTSEAPPPFPR